MRRLLMPSPPPPPHHTSLSFIIIIIAITLTVLSLLQAPTVTATTATNMIFLHNSSDLVQFSEMVNSGTTFNGTTVFMDADIDFADEGDTETFVPIGSDINNYFLGTFDGQGYVISHLVINTTTLRYVGLFGYTQGTAIKNVELENTCSITSVGFNATISSYVGSFVGYCDSTLGPCSVESSVNTANVTATGLIYAVTHVGGIVGAMHSFDYPCVVVNCANYGWTASVGTGIQVYIGGLVGACIGSSLSGQCDVRNSVNFGKVIIYKVDSNGDGGSSNNNNSSNRSKLTNVKVRVYAGGIAGSNEYGVTENCVSAGMISTDSVLQSACVVGSIVGHSLSWGVDHCYWDGRIPHDACGENVPSALTGDSCAYSAASLRLNERVHVRDTTVTDLVTALNGIAEGYYIYNNYSHWGGAFNHSRVSFTVNGRRHEHSVRGWGLVLLVGLADEGTARFYGWYTDAACTTPLKNYTFRTDTTLYGLWEANTERYTISFDTRGRNTTALYASVEGQYMQRVALPRGVTAAPTEAAANCTFRGWVDMYEAFVADDFAVPARNVTLYAAWFCTHIGSANEFFEFSRAVNTVPDFAGAMTLYLDADIDFAGFRSCVTSIGYHNAYNDDYHFRGAFDGQGHVLHNLHISTRKLGAALFGYSFHGVAIRNIVLDASCTVDSMSTSSVLGAGGILGYCFSGSTACVVENSVNMAIVTYDRITHDNEANVGGIVGYCGAYLKECAVVNCANYGIVRQNRASMSSYIGGVIGQCFVYISTNRCRVINNLNYGIVINTPTTTEYAYTGGIIGYGKRFSTIENCLNAGAIISLCTRNEWTGTIVGYLQKSTANHCLWLASIPSTVSLPPVGKKDESSSSKLMFFSNTTFIVNGTTTTVDNEMNSYIIFHNSNSKYKSSNRGEEAKSVKVSGGSGGSINVKGTDLEQLSGWAINRNGAFIAYNLNGMPYVTFKSQVILVPNVLGNDKMRFRGWYITNTSQELYPMTEFTGNTSLWGYFEPVPSRRGAHYTIRWVFLECAAITIFFSGVVALVFVVTRKLRKRAHENSQIRELVEPFLCETLDGSLNDTLPELYPEGYAPPSLRTALVNAGFPAEAAPAAVRMCYRHAEDLRDRNMLYGDENSEDLTLDDVAAIALYTMDFDPDSAEKNCTPYMLLNSALMAGTPEALAPAKDLLFFFMRALRKLPIVHGKPLYRGIRSDFATSFASSSRRSFSLASGPQSSLSSSVSSLSSSPSSSVPPKATMGSSSINSSDGDVGTIVACDNNNDCVDIPKVASRTTEASTGQNYYAWAEGEEAVWRAISSTSPDVSVTKAFLAKCSASGKAEGTLFIIEGGWGYNVQPFSLYPDEEEIVLEPERLLRVTSVISGEGLTVVKMDMLKTPLVLPDIFGKKVFKLF